MKIALIGASGFVGAALLQEAVSRGDSVTAIARSPEKIAALPGVTTVKADILDVAATASLLKGHDVAISAFNGGWGDPDIYAKHLEGSRAIAEAAKQAGVRIIVVGGAGSLYAPDGSQFVDSPEFPAEWKEGAKAARDALGELRQSTGLQWSFISPAFHLEPGERTGAFRLGKNEPVFDAKGESRISVGDMAVAIMDEAENPKHTGSRFTLGY